MAVAEYLEDHLPSFSLPVVVKADGLMAGKGVVIAWTWEEAAVAWLHLAQGKYVPYP
jgi:phosphoribosylamine-glycine ligase